MNFTSMMIFRPGSVVRLVEIRVTKMKESRRTLSLAGLRDFEATARSGSFVSAGLELGVSASAVSQQVKLLEERLGVRLFDRRPQSLSVTASGRKLLATLTGAFDL